MWLPGVAGAWCGAQANQLPPRPLPPSCHPPLRRCSYLQAAAALVQYPGTGVSRELRRLLAWVPVKRFSTAVMQVAVMAWHWVLASGSQELQVAMLSDITDAWSYTVRARMGLFADYDADQHAAHAAGAGSANVVDSSNGDVNGDANGDASALDCANGDANGSASGGSSPSAAAHADPAAEVDAIRAHHQWVAFLWEVRVQLVGWARRRRMLW